MFHSTFRDMFAGLSALKTTFSETARIRDAFLAQHKQLLLHAGVMMALFLSRMIGVWARQCGQGLRFRLLRSGAHMLDAESVCGYGDVGKACVLAFCGFDAHVFVSDSEILKNTGLFNNEIDFAGSEALICRSSWRLCARTDEGRLSRESHGP